MAITHEEVLKIAELAKLQFDASELQTFTAQFQHILDYIEQLKEVAVEGIDPTSHVSLAADFAEPRFREDEILPSLTVEEALRNAPDQSHDHFRVPNVLKMKNDES